MTGCLARRLKSLVSFGKHFQTKNSRRWVFGGLLSCTIRLRWTVGGRTCLPLNAIFGFPVLDAYVTMKDLVRSLLITMRDVSGGVSMMMRPLLLPYHRLTLKPWRLMPTDKRNQISSESTLKINSKYQTGRATPRPVFYKHS